MYTVEFSERAQKKFEGLNSEEMARVNSVIERILVKPRAFALKMNGSEAYRIRVGKLRLIIDINEKEEKIVVLKIGNRENVYSP